MRPRLNILSEELIARIVDEAKRVLAEVGMEIRGTGDAPRLLDHGLPLDDSGERVLFPRDVVERPSPTRPRSFVLYDRAGNPHADLGGDRVHFVPGSSGLKVLDHRTGETRLANSTDFVEYVRLADGLANIPYLATAFSTNDDIEAQVSDAWRLYMTLTNSNKPVVSGAFTEHGVPRMVEMMQLFRRDRADLIARPMSIFTITATGNFRYSEDSCQNLIDCVEAGHRGRDRAGHADGPDRPGDRRSAPRSSTRSTCWPGSRWPRSSGPAPRSCSAVRRRRST